jgi:hypothetical protein
MLAVYYISPRKERWRNILRVACAQRTLHEEVVHVWCWPMNSNTKRFQRSGCSQKAA